MTIRLPPLFLFSLIILQACKKNNNEPIGPNELASNCGTRLRMISSLDKESNTTYFRSLNYVGERLETFVDSILFPGDNSTYVGVSSSIKRVEYDQGGRIIQITERDGPSDSVYQLWFYDAQNLIVKSIFISKLERDTLQHIYSYDIQKRLVIDSAFDNKKQNLVNYTTFRYDTNGNAVEWNHYTNESGTLANDLKAEITYDNHPNPFQGIGLYTVPYEDDYSGLSRNNIIRLTLSNVTVTEYQYQYQYCDNGWPKSAVLTIAPNQKTVRNIAYQYY